MGGRLGTRPGQTHTGIGVSFGALKYDVRHAALVELEKDETKHE